MCLYPKLILNKKYLGNKKNQFNPPELTDERVKFVAIGCGKCLECMQQKANSWRIRLMEELKVNYGTFVTLTFSNECLEYICAQYKINETNAAAAKAVRLFLERYRKKYKRSCRHFLITELGHDNTERIHLHGIIFEKMTQDELHSLWSYGWVYRGKYCNEKTINYVMKYVLKIDTDHKNYVPQILCSPGIGKNYVTRIKNFGTHNFAGKDTKDFYRLRNGTKLALPIYYRNKLFTEEQREELWIHRIEQAKRYVLGVAIENIDTLQGERLYFQTLKKARAYNKEVGYGSDEKEWKKCKYNVTLRMLNRMREQPSNTETRARGDI